MWYYVLNEEKHGPMSAQGLGSLVAQNAIGPQTLVWRDGLPNWLPMRDTELAAQLRLPLPEGDAWDVCGYSGEVTPRSAMIPLGGCWVAATHKDEAVEFLHQGGQLPRIELPSGLAGNTDLGHLIRSTWDMVAGQWRCAVALNLIVGLPVSILADLLAESMPAHGPAAESLNTLVAVPFNCLTTAGTLFLMRQHLRGMKPTLSETFAGSFANWGRLCLAQLLSGLVTLAGMFLLLIPGLIFAVRTSLSAAAAVDGRMSGSAAVQQSFELTRGRFWMTLLYVIMMFIVCLLPSVVLDMITTGVTVLDQGVVRTVAENLAELPTIYFTAFVFIYYKELVVAADGRRPAFPR